MSETVFCLTVIVCCLLYLAVVGLLILWVANDIGQRMYRIEVAIRDWQSDQPTRLDLPFAEEVPPEPNTSNQEELDFLNDPDGWRHR